MYILFATISGGIYFQEFAEMSPLQWVIFCVGICVMFYGLYLVSPEDSDEPEGAGDQAHGHSTSTNGKAGDSPRRAKTQPTGGATLEVTAFVVGPDQRESAAERDALDRQRIDHELMRV